MVAHALISVFCMQRQAGLLVGDQLVVHSPSPVREKTMPLINKTTTVKLKTFLRHSSIAVKRCPDHSNSYKRAFHCRPAYSFRDLVHYGHSRDHSGMQTDTVLEK